MRKSKYLTLPSVCCEKIIFFFGRRSFRDERDVVKGKRNGFKTVANLILIYILRKTNGRNIFYTLQQRWPTLQTRN